MSAGIEHADPGSVLSYAEYTGTTSHQLDNSTSFPGSPSEMDLFYRTDEHKWYIRTNADWIDLTSVYGDSDVESYLSGGIGIAFLSGVISVDLSELTDMTAAVDGSQDEMILLDNSADRRKLLSEINLSAFNDDLTHTPDAHVLATTGPHTGQLPVSDMLFNASIIPNATTYYLGSDTYEWAGLYIKTGGNVYLSGDQLEYITSDGDFIDIWTNGTKDFRITAGVLIPPVADNGAIGSTNYEIQNIYLGTGKYFMYTDQYEWMYSNGTAIVLGVNNADELLLSPTALYPNVDAGLSLGTTTYRYNELHTDYIVLGIPGTNLTAGPGSKIFVGTAAENLVFGNLVYLNGSAQWAKADADADTSVGFLGMALGTINISATGNILLYGFVRDDSWTWTDGGINGQLYISNTAGEMVQTPPAGTGDQVQCLGYAYTGTVIYFKPSNDILEI